MEKTELKHFGKIGMHWGSKKAAGSSKGNSMINKHIAKLDAKKAEKPPNSADHNLKVSLKNKEIKTLSNSQLKKFNERLQLEKTYKQLTKEDISPGKKFVTDLIVNSGKQLAQTYITKYMGKGIDTLLSKTKSNTSAK